MRNIELFRKQALRKLTSPEQLDRALSVTSSRGWVAIAALLLASTTVVGWSFLGQVSTYAQGNALLLSSGGSVVDAVSSGQVRLLAFEVQVGDEIGEDQVVAIGFNEEIAERLAGARALEAEQAQAMEDDRTAVEEESRIARENDERERNRLDESEATARASVETTQAILDDNIRLYDEGVVTRSALERSREEANRARRQLLAVMRERDELEANVSSRKHSLTVRLRESDARLQAAERQVRELEVLAQSNRILAPVAGRVTEIKAAIGTIVNPGQAVLSIRTGGEGLEALIYIEPTEGPRVEVGMDALISPIRVRREEFGAIRGTVDSLSQFPVSMDGIMADLQNRELARMFSEEGAPYSGRVSLRRDPTTASGFAWTSPKASNEPVASGTLATVEIRTNARRPITLVIPALKEFLGI